MSSIQTEDELYEMLARAGETQRRPAGAVIFSAGDEAVSMYILVSGTVSLKRGDDVIGSIGGPSLFGELALIDYAPRSLTVVAHDEVVLVEIPERRFWVLVHETPRFAQLVMRVMAARLRERSGTS
ncbi:MAG: cyclic nucleotide-binding domain-containing protein [Solirubrobacteraceae bacterium]|jgi:CRP-like cAMP-binding protein